MDDTHRKQRDLSELGRELDRHFAAIDVRLSRIEGKFPTDKQRIDAMFDRFESNMIRALFVQWLATVIPLAGLIVIWARALQN